MVIYDRGVCARVLRTCAHPLRMKCYLSSACSCCPGVGSMFVWGYGAEAIGYGKDWGGVESYIFRIDVRGKQLIKTYEYYTYLIFWNSHLGYLFVFFNIVYPES